MFMERIMKNTFREPRASCNFSNLQTAVTPNLLFNRSNCFGSEHFHRPTVIPNVFDGLSPGAKLFNQIFHYVTGGDRLLIHDIHSFFYSRR
ncbi:hypothetical protein B5X24_HaOG216684 [Helicoverpa armigera]|nr:hypothetical protein B5X24_HaOG216684 [Helicoverpa armigera]